MSETMSPAPSPIEVLRQYSESEAPRVEADLEAERQNAQRLFDVPGEFFRMMTVTICSVWPEPLDSQPFHHNGSGRRIYSIAAGSPENPSYLTLENVWDWVIVQEGQGERGDRQATITAAEIARDLIRYWAGDHPGNRRGKKGIGVIRGHYNDKARRLEATKAEIEELEKQQRGFLTYLVERADQFWDNGQRDKISREHKKAFAMLGLDHAQHPWVRSKIQLYNDCPWCAKKVEVQAIFCGNCRQSISDYFITRNLVPDKAQWSRVFEDVERMAAAGARKK